MREKILINNLLTAICDTTDIAKDQYEDWLKLEIGFTDEEIQELKDKDLFPEPIN